MKVVRQTLAKTMIAPAQTVNLASPPHLDLEKEIVRLKREMNAVILAHYYQDSEIQDLADFVGDSLQLSQQAAATKADVIVFAGVLFMAETAKILNPSKPVLLPDLKAGCSLADGCPANLFQAFRDRHPGHVSITYINCSAEVKALSDIICTSSNAEKIIRQIPEEQPILFAPDQHLGRFLIKKTGREMTLWPGSCIVHEMFSEKSLVQLKERHPGALVIAHPECPEAVLRHADYVGSTSGLLNYSKQSPAKEFIVATESGILHQMEKACPEKTFISAPGEGGCSCSECPHMKLNTMEKLYLCMRDRKPEIILDEDLRQRALKPILRMLEMS
ncbi:MAG TPA: quinolinate synthase NadA [Candidatus Acidoferrales bacterium]|nr:quinolinate synthase NadA [Candidatus Acidoferrales bacterium]